MVAGTGEECVAQPLTVPAQEVEHRALLRLAALVNVEHRYKTNFADGHGLIQAQLLRALTLRGTELLISAVFRGCIPSRATTSRGQHASRRALRPSALMRNRRPQTTSCSI